MTTTHTDAPLSGMKPRLLLAEDDTEMRVFLASQLSREGYDVVECTNGQELVNRLASLFIDHVQPERIDLVISDIRMPVFSGLKILEGLHQDERLPPIILITAFGDEKTHARARRLGAVATFDKPFHLPDLVAKVRDTIGEGHSDQAE